MARDETKTPEGKSMADLLDKPTSRANGTDSGNTTQLAVLEVEDFNLISETLQAEVIDTIRSQFTGSVMYNIPRRSPSGGKKEWPACAQMPNGYCSYKGENHIHIVDVGIHGALVAAGVYGNLDFGVKQRPTVAEENDKLYWICEVFCYDEIRGNKITRWEFEPVMKKTRGGGFYEDEFAMKTVQSKGIRNMILAILPPHLRELWKKDYLEGRTPFDPSRILEAGGRGSPALPPKKEKKTPPPKEEKKDEKKQNNHSPNSAGSNDLSTVIAQFADKYKVTPEIVGEWSSIEFDTPGQAMLNLTKALQDEEKAAEFVAKIKEYEKNAVKGNGEDVDMEPA